MEWINLKRAGSAARQTLAAALWATTLAIAAPAPADAVSPALEAARRDCAVAEGADGFLHAKGGLDKALLDEVSRVNAQRRAAYAQIAARNGATVAMTAEITGAKLVERLPRGQCYRAANGQWVRK